VELTLGSVRYQVAASESHGRWTATVVRLDNGQHAGPDVTGVTEEQAVQRACRWLEWQYEHALALDALQQAERAYHRVVAGNAFAAGEEGSSAETQRESLDAVDAARRALDEVRAKRPL
jgi:hypothetical protein